MTATAILDEQGRLIIPEEFREHLHLAPGDAFEINEEDGKLVLSPAAAKSSLEKIGDMWVVNAERLPGYEEVDTVQLTREERIRDLIG